MTPFPLDGGRAGDGGGGEPFDRLAREAVNPAEAVPRARRLRSEMTVGEKVLWAELRRLKLHFRRQVPIGRYVADFALHSAGLIVEVDGPHHEIPERRLSDEARDAWLKSQVYTVLRFTAAEVLNDVGAVVRQITSRLPPPPSPALPPSRGKGGAHA